MKKYFLEFLVVFFGILLSFMIDNRMKYSERVDNKNFLLGQLNEVIKEDQIQLKIVESTLNDCLESISILIYDHKNKILHDSAVVKHFSNVSSKMSISFFPQKSIYNQIVQSQYLELIENKKLKENLASLYEHLNYRNESVNLKLDLFNQEFDLALIDLVYYRTILNEVENSVDLDTSIKDYKISKGYRNNNLVVGYYANAEKRVIFYLELLKKYREIMIEIATELNK
ncbi:MAG: hypothetical protein CMB90_03495 [Flammeovirgaceae bacterium]|nr:hypothetical protein [Flammeovirgaceae bacterium]|tara:strand:+ start:3246 stop:3929 length:684 start_codon:yes stop_codon:yes gene_type:complete